VHVRLGIGSERMECDLGSLVLYVLFGSKVGINPHGFRRESPSPTVRLCHTLLI